MNTTLLAIFVSLVFSLGVAKADFVVISSTAPSLKPGDLVGASQVLQLAKGVRVSLISQTGQTVKLRGPYEGDVGKDLTGNGGEGDTLIHKLARLMSDPKGSSVLAATRRLQPTPWDIEFPGPDVHCVRQSKTVRFWRQKKASPEQLQLRSAGEPTALVVQWRQGARAVIWPSEIPLQDGHSYEARMPLSNLQREFKLRIVPDDLPTHAHRAAWMGDNDCSDQARAVLMNAVR